MNKSLKDKLAESGWFLTNETLEPKYYFKYELIENTISFIINTMALIPLFLSIIVFYLASKLPQKPKKKRILFGPHIVVHLKLLRKILEDDFDCTSFIYDDYTQKVDDFQPVTAHDIMPGFIARKYTYSIGRYWAFIWALKNFDVHVHYFNSGFLDRTFIWKLEPLIYQLLNKKIVLFPHGADAWDLLRNNNRYSKLGHMLYAKNYFNQDFKRIKRMYWWSKYAHLIFGQINFIDFLPRIDILAFRIEVISDIESHQYSFQDPKGKVKIVHYANDGIRKGSHFIRNALNELKNERDDFEFECCEGLDRFDALKKLDAAHIYIEQITDGFFSISAVEAMLKGKIVLTGIDNKLVSFFQYLNNEYYANDNKLPVIDTNMSNLKDNVHKLLNNKEAIKALSIRSRKYAKKLLADNEKAYKQVFSALLDY